MISKKNGNFVYELSSNSRIKTKELGQKLKISQQSASYLVSSLKQKKTIIDNTLILDPAKFGFITILVYYNFADFSSKSINEIISYLKQNDDIVNVEMLNQGYDLACTFCVPNLSHFNKTNRDFLQSFRRRIFALDIFPIVVKHIYPKNYLTSRKNISEKIICGDRDVISITENEKKVLEILYDDPTSKIIKIIGKTKMNPKTVIKIKSKLEKGKIIRGYSTNWDYEKLKIHRRQILFSSEDLSLKDDLKLLEFAKVHPFVVGLTKLIGRYDILVEVEGENLSNKDVLKELRSEFDIKRYKVIPSSVIVKDKYIPKSSFE
jgi:DNA-binding Lrp family transcriptional regulator